MYCIFLERGEELFSIQEYNANQTATSANDNCIALTATVISIETKKQFEYLKFKLQNLLLSNSSFASRSTCYDYWITLTKKFCSLNKFTTFYAHFSELCEELQSLGINSMTVHLTIRPGINFVITKKQNEKEELCGAICQFSRWFCYFKFRYLLTKAFHLTLLKYC